MNIEIGGPSNGGGDDSGGGGSSRKNVVRRFGPPPAFLTKTFHMVNDPNTNSIISWNKFGDSFIISDHIKFSAEILPNYFKHNNFSSFVYQLNNYGFRKIGVDHQWEYSSPHFQEGKPHLLSNMKRRRVEKPSHQREKGSLETLRKSMEEWKQELKKVKRQQSAMEFHVMELKQKADNLEAASKKMEVQWAKACKIIVEGEKVVKEDAAGKSSPAANDGPKSADEMIGDYFVELDNVKKIIRLFDDDDDDEVCKVGDVNMQHAIAQDFEEWLIDSLR